MLGPSVNIAIFYVPAMRLLRLACLIGAALAATACGIKGPLTLPDGTTSQNNTGKEPKALPR
jgi:predicted small lipoprotein YifL